MYAFYHVLVGLLSRISKQFANSRSSKPCLHGRGHIGNYSEYTDISDISVLVNVGGMKRILQKIYHCSRVYGFTAAGAVAVIGFVIYEKTRNNTAYSSWTTNHDPSVKWDANWDRSG